MKCETVLQKMANYKEVSVKLGKGKLANSYL